MCCGRDGGVEEDQLVVAGRAEGAGWLGERGERARGGASFLSNVVDGGAEVIGADADMGRGHGVHGVCGSVLARGARDSRPGQGE